MTLKYKRVAMRAVWYSIFVAIVLNLLFQFGLTWHQFDSIIQAQPLLVIAAILNQIIAYGVIVPAMGKFMQRCGILLSPWRTFALVSAGLASSRVLPAGEYFLWRVSLSKHRGGVAATSQWFIIYFTAMFAGLALMFIIFEALSLLFYPQTHVDSLVGYLKYIPMAVVGIIIVCVGALKIKRFRAWLSRVAFEKVTNRAFSPGGIFRERKLGWSSIGWLALASCGSWFIEGYTLFLCLASLGLDVPFIVAITAYLFARLITNLPIIPGGIGEMEAMLVLFFAAYGYPVELVVSAALLLRLITYWPPIAIGAIAYFVTDKFGKGEPISIGLKPFAQKFHQGGRTSSGASKRLTHSSTPTKS